MKRKNRSAGIGISSGNGTDHVFAKGSDPAADPAALIRRHEMCLLSFCSLSNEGIIVDVTTTEGVQRK